MKQIYSIAIILIVILGLGGYLVISRQSPKIINSFEECAAAGYPIMESYPEQCRTPDGRSFTKSLTSQEAEFGSSITLRVNEQVTFGDGLVVTLVEINDSRCKSGVVCIWAGELSSRFILLGGNVTEFKEVRVGTATTKSATQNGYTLTLKEATENTATITITKGDEQVACTMEAKLCSDGSAVGRTGPKCEFAPCPTTTGKQVSLKEGQRQGPLLVEKIYPDYITGLIYREYPVAMDQGSPITMHIGDVASNGCTVTLTLITIENNTATFTENTDYNRPCPICLAEGTLIDAPSGKIAVQDLKVGDIIWTKDLAGNRISAPIIAVAKTPVPLTHRVVYLKLYDGRELFASPGHPVADGRLIGGLKKGEILDGGVITKIEKVAYRNSFTYDILPAGGTGLYFANGILIGSTLFK